MTKEKLLSTAYNCATFKDLGECFAVSKQRAYQICESWNVLDEVRELLLQNKSLGTRIKLENISGKFCVFFKNAPKKKFYVYSTNCRKAAQSILSNLKTGELSNEYLQKDYDRWGEDALEFEFLGKETYDMKRDFLISIDKKYNLRLISTMEEIKERKRDCWKKHNILYKAKYIKEPDIYFHRSGFYLVNAYVRPFEQKYLGYFPTLEEAIKVRDAFRIKHPRDIPYKPRPRRKK